MDASPTSSTARDHGYVIPANDILRASGQRGGPTPKRPWTMRQVWSDLLFAHWPSPARALAERLPPGMELDTWEGEAWIGVVPFRMPYLSVRWLPDLPPFTHLLEINVRTYVRVGGKPGIYFFSLDADNPITIEIARRWYALPYFNARFDCKFSERLVDYRVTRTDWRAASGTFAARYRPTAEPHLATPGSLEDWLTARYALYTVTRRGRIMRCDVAHAPWRLSPAEAEITTNTLAQSRGVTLADTAPLLHYSARIDTLAWSITPAR